MDKEVAVSLKAIHSTSVPSFFVSEKGLARIYKKAIYYFPVSYFCFATSQNCILAEPR